jgi:hypothetical protein
MKRQPAKQFYLIAAVSCISLLTGCGDSAQGVKLAKEFGQTADEFKEKTDKLANDIYASCIRRARYIDLVAVPGREADEVRFEALKNCELLNKPTATRAVMANTVVYDYIKAVGHLAGDKNVSFQSELEEVRTSLINLGQTQLPFVLPEQAVNQGITIANAVFEWAAKSYRNIELSKAVICTKEPLKAYTTGLGQAYDSGYINGILANEEDTVRRYFNGIATSQTASLKNSTKVMVVRDYEALNSNSYDSLMTVRNNRAAAARYIKVLSLTATANADIADELSKAGYIVKPEQCSAYLKPPAGQSPVSSLHLQPNHQPILSFWEKSRITQILTKYNSHVRHELDQIKL